MVTGIFTAIEKRAKTVFCVLGMPEQPMLGVTFKKVCTYPFLIPVPWGGKKEVNGEEGKTAVKFISLKDLGKVTKMLKCVGFSDRYMAACFILAKCLCFYFYLFILLHGDLRSPTRD